MYLYVKAIHIIFVVTWFAGLFYMPRLFIYAAEANTEPEPAKGILQERFRLMSRRLWYAITWPSAIVTLCMGTWMGLLYGRLDRWLVVKLGFVLLLYVYHFSLHKIFLAQQRNDFSLSPQKLRIWNEAATLLLVAIVFLAVVKNVLSLLWGGIGIVALMVILLVAIRIYKKARIKNEGKV